MPLLEDSSEPLSRLEHELQVAQVELELQNEELRKANQRLQSQFERYFALFDSAPVGYLIVNRNAVIQDVNIAGAALLEKTRNQLHDVPLLTFLDLDSRMRLIAELRRVSRQEAVGEPLEMVLSLRDTPVHVLARASWVPTESGGSILLSLSDVTELRATQKSLETARLDAEQNDMAKSEFVAALSHEIRTPLASVVAYADLVMREHPRHPAGEHVRLIARAAEQVTALVNDVLDMAKIESSSIELRRNAFEPRAVLDYARQITEPIRTERACALSSNVHDGVPLSVLGDRDRYQQCVLNLVSNAVKFAPEGGRVHLTVSYRSGTLITIVDDDGPGVPDEKKELIFRPYRQADSSDTRRYGGVGLGLAITQRLATFMGGQVLVGDSVMGGARFVLQVPFAVGVLTPVAVLPTVLPARRRTLRRGPLLVVDDDPTIREFLGAVLEHLEIEHEFATSGVEALTLLRDREFRAMVLDMQMPEMDGLEVARRIRASPKLNDLPIAALTAKVMKHEVHECLAAGCDTHIPKPVRVSDLHQHLTRLFALNAA